MVEITLENLIFAYRKAKVDLYFSVDSRELDLLEYEGNLHARLSALLLKINGTSSGWVEAASFIGGYSIVPKSLSPDPSRDDASIFSPGPDRQSTANAGGEKAVATFRVISQCSIDMHVLTSLWLMTAGAKFDAELSKSSMGNRLRRRRDGAFNELAIGSFKPYLEPFRRWREDGLVAIERALDDGKRVAAVTGDATSYYHALSPDFLGNSDFVSGFLGVEMTDVESRVNDLFVTSLNAWSTAVATQLGTPSAGLPVGLPASAVVANLALIEFDRFIERELTPLYYGRYVDDFFLVLEDGLQFSSAAAVWDWIVARAEPELHLSATAEGLVFAPSYLSGSVIRFENQKNRSFKLRGRTGRALISSIRRNIAEQGSEWRALPSFPTSRVDVGTRLVIAMQANGDPADNLRKADTLTARRAKFALQLRDFEAFQRDLEPSDWTQFRQEFFDSVCDHVLTPSGYFQLWTYLPRLLRLALACGDYGAFATMVARLSAMIEVVFSSTNLRVAGSKDVPDDLISSWRAQVASIIKQAIATTIPRNPGEVLRGAVKQFDHELFEWISETDVAGLNKRLLVRDLAHMPARFAILPAGIVPWHAPRLVGQVSLDESLREFLPRAISTSLDSLREIVQNEHFDAVASSIVFPTRPANLVELFIVGDPLLTQAQERVRERMEHVANAVLGLRGFTIHRNLPGLVGDGDGGSFIAVDDASSSLVGKRKIAIGSVETLGSQSDRAALGSPDLSLARYRRLSTTVNDLMSRSGTADYLVLPELSLPSRWFVRTAQKLGARGINLVAGLEYARHDKTVQNQVWASLTHTHFGFPSLMVYRQDKQRPAHGELVRLSELDDLRLEPNQKWLAPPVIRHGQFFFAVIVCSELTNIAHRASLRGRVDALFVPEWNRDIHTFEALVESAALDIHAFIVQANNRAYGDSRIRVPAVNEWERDLIRHRGGMHDYTVVGEIDFDVLREHQSVRRASAPRFKPLPDGFVVSAQRFRLPRGR